MKSRSRSITPRVRDTESGQSLVLILLMLAVLLGVAALAVDMGNLYYCYQDLKSTTQSAALAGGAAIVSSKDALTVAYQFSGQAPTDYNYHPNLNVAPFSLTATATLGCISPTAYPNYGLPACDVYGPNKGNAVKVTESTRVPTFFAKIFGVSSVPISATSVASATGGPAGSWNVAVVLDTTPSMNFADSNCGLSGKNATRLGCALEGIQTLLKTLTPCAVGSSCTVTNANNRVSLFTFPNVSTAQAPNDSSCGSTPSALPTSFPPANGTTYNPTGSTTPTYQITNYLSNYQGTTPTTPPTLSGSSGLVTAVGGGTCAGIGAPTSGWGAGVTNITYYAGAIYAAQASLTATQAANPLSKNAMVILTDGDASNTKSFMASGATALGTYPSWVDQCGQAVAAAKAATLAGTRIYSVAYGSASSGCSTDTTTTQNSRNITPCQTMEGMASSAAYFYSDYNQSGSPSTCQSASQPITNLHDIFLSIGESLTSARLMPGTLAFTPN